MGFSQNRVEARVDHSVVVFAKNERSTIERCLESVLSATAGLRTHLTVIVNGSTDGSGAAAARALSQVNANAAVYSISYADKSNAINSFLYKLRPQAAFYHFVDGYVTIAPNAIHRLADQLACTPEALASAGVPRAGRRSRSQRQSTLLGGVIGGQLFCLRHHFVERVVQGGIRLPVGLYRGDGLLASFANHDLDALGTQWDTQRVVACSDAEFSIPRQASSLSMRQFGRRVRQARGRLESAAIKSIIYTAGFEALPADANAMLRHWLRTNALPKASILERFFRGIAIRQALSAKPVEPEMLQPRLVAAFQRNAGDGSGIPSDDGDCAPSARVSRGPDGLAEAPQHRENAT